ncbi:MAG: amidohydrolase family protein [Candidatus Acidiferrales bacterium]
MSHLPQHSPSWNETSRRSAYFNPRHLEFLLLAAFCLASIFVWAHAARGEGGEPRYFAIRGARIVPVDGPVIENGTVVVAKGLIAAVGTNVEIPPEAWVIDGKGLTVYPGLIDAGNNLALPPAEKSGDAGDPQSSAVPAKISMGPEDRPASTPWRVVADELNPSDKRITAWRNAGFTTVLTSPDDGILPGQGSLIDLEGDRAGRMVVKAAATVPISLHPLTGIADAFPDSLMGSIAYVRQVFDDASWYAEAQPVYEANRNRYERPAYDRTERVIAQARERNELFLLPGNNSVRILRALRLANEWKIRAAIYGGQQGYAVVPEIAAGKIPVLVSLKWPAPPKDPDPDPDARPTLRVLRFRDRAPGTPAAFAKAGILFAFYSDGLSSPKEIFKAVKKAMDAGLSPDAALRAFTLNAAEILGEGDRLGSIAPGKIANLVVTDGDLFGEKTKVKDVFVDGRWFEIHEEAESGKPGDHENSGEDDAPEQVTRAAAARNAGTAGASR